MLPESPVLNPKPHGTSSWPTSKSPLTPFLPTVSLLHASKLPRESSTSLLHLAFQLPKLHGKGSPKAAWVPSLAKAVWFSPSRLPHLSLNPSANLPLQPHFRLLPQSATSTSTHVFLQLFWAAIVSPGRHGPMTWSQPSSSSQTGAITRGNCLPVTSLIKVTPISVAQSTATAT